MRQRPQIQPLVGKRYPWAVWWAGFICGAALIITIAGFGLFAIGALK